MTEEDNPTPAPSARSFEQAGLAEVHEELNFSMRNLEACLHEIINRQTVLSARVRALEGLLSALTLRFEQEFTLRPRDN
jgi:hypothetical protein